MHENPPLILGTDFVAVPTNDLDASCHFYGEVLGLPCIAHYGQAPGAEFQAGNLTLAVMQSEGFGASFAPNSLPIALRVADVAAARERLMAVGVSFHSEPFDSGVCLQATFSDPAGSPLSLHHRYAEPNPAGDQSTLASATSLAGVSPPPRSAKAAGTEPRRGRGGAA